MKIKPNFQRQQRDKLPEGIFLGIHTSAVLRPGELLSQVSIWCSGGACLSFPSLDLPSADCFFVCVCLPRGKKTSFTYICEQVFTSFCHSPEHAFRGSIPGDGCHSPEHVFHGSTPGDGCVLHLLMEVGSILLSRHKLAKSWLFVEAEWGSFCYSILTVCICKTKNLRAPVPSNHCSKKKNQWKWISSVQCYPGHCHGVEDTSRATEKLHFQFCLILLKLLHIVSVYSRCWEVAIMPYYKNSQLINSVCKAPFPSMQETEAGGPLSSITGSWMMDCIGAFSQSPFPFCFPGLLYVFWGEGVAARISCISCWWSSCLHLQRSRL